jgi:uncharacterized protein (UPF0332 family)
MSTQETQRERVIRYWLEMAHESLIAARREADANALSFAMNRLYYAAFYAASAVLFERGVSFEKHTAVRASLHRDLIKPGLLDKEWGRLYDQLFEDRQQGDYLPFTTFDDSFVEEQIAATANFITAMEALLDCPSTMTTLGQ